jgi:hypothetical protein
MAEQAGLTSQIVLRAVAGIVRARIASLKLDHEQHSTEYLDEALANDARDGNMEPAMVAVIRVCLEASIASEREQLCDELGSLADVLDRCAAHNDPVTTVLGMLAAAEGQHA